MNKTFLLIAAAAALVTGAALAEGINVEPLLTTKWNQISPYIDFGPVKPDQENGYAYENHMVNGCVAVAYSQVMKYWGWPEKIEEDVSYMHLANATYGFAQTLPAGTEFHWEGQLDDYVTGGRKPTQTEILYLGLGQIFTAMMTEMKFNLSMSGVNLDRAVDNPYYYSGDTINTVGQTTLAMCEDQARDSIVAGAPLIMGVEINYEGRDIAHAVVGDGWKKTGDAIAQIHLNYGWGGNNQDQFYPFNLETSRFIANHKPRPMVVIDPVPQRAKLPLRVAWHFPKKGYENDIKGFDVKAYKVTNELCDWTEDFENATGASWGEDVKVGTLANCGNASKMLQFNTYSSRDHYSWPTMFLGEGSEFSFRVRSERVRSHQTAWVEAYESNRGWKKIYDIQLYESPLAENNGWTNVTVKLDAAYANKAVGFRFRTSRAAQGDSWSGSDTYGIQIDDVKVTNVYRTEATPTATESVGHASRAAQFDSGLEIGQRYVFFVEPKVKDGVMSSGTGTEIVSAAPQELKIYGVQSVCAGAPAFESENVYREAYLGTNQFAVFGTSNMTKLRVYMSQTSLIDFYWEKDAASSDPNAKVASYRLVSVADSVKVEDAGAGRFLVTVDFSNCTKALRYTREVLTLEGEDDFGNIVRKQIMLVFSRFGNETAVTTAQVPTTYSGPMPSATPVEPVRYDVTFDANGGEGTVVVSYESGSIIGNCPEPTKTGCRFAGWYTKSMDGNLVGKDWAVDGNVTYYAHWTENSTSEDDPNPPGVTTCTVTFDPNGGAVTLERSVEKGGVIGALPEIVRDGYAMDGWYTLAEGGTKVSALTTVDADITYYAHWNVSSGGGDEPGGGDPVDDGNTRFCHGVSSTAGSYDVTRSGTWNTITPVGFNLIFWWVDRYEEVNGSKPSDYIALSTSSIPDNGSWTIQSYTANLLNSALPTTLPAGDTRNSCFPTTSYAVNAWNGGVAGAGAVKEAGKRIYAALANGPIGVKVVISLSRSYGAVIWGCDYAIDGNDKYATKVYITETTSNTRNDTVVLRELKWTETNDGTFTNVGIKDFNGSGNPGVIDYYYPIIGPASSGGGDDEPTVKTFIVTFDSDGGSAVNAQSVEDGESLVSIPAPTKSGYAFAGWYDGETRLTTSTKITANVTFTAYWTAVVAPDDPTPDEPVVPADEVIGVADNSKDPGNDYTASYGYEMYDNYWTARKRAMQQGKQLFVLSGAAWCSNCAFVKKYLTSLGTDFSNRFVVYYSDNDSTTCNCFRGGLPQYGAADPRAVDAFTGTLNGSVRSWDIAWQTDTSGIYKQDRGGYASERVEAVVTAGRLKAAYGCPTDLVIRGLSTLGTGKVGRYELFARYADGVEMPVDYGVEWKVVSGTGTVSDANVDGRDVAALTVASGSVVLQAKSTFYFTGSKSITVDCAPETDIESVEIITSEVNLEDDATPTIEAEATLKNGKKIPVFGFGVWKATFDHRIDRTDPELEENSDAALNPTITVDDESRLNYALNNGLLEVCDQVVNLKLTVNGKSHTKQVTVWGPTKVIPSEWTVVSAATQTTPGVVRLNCTKLKYNYGGEIKTTSDSYFASYEIVLKNGVYSQVSHLRGLTVYVNDPNASRDYKVSIRAKKVNGKYTGYLPAIPDESSTAPTVTCIARGAARTEIDKGLVPNGFFQAFFPGRTDYEALAEEDADGDGFKNWEEYVLGTDPTDKSDAFALMQGYQHLTAPAANGATMQYKVMYQQRAGRVYYIDGKKAWGDDWTQVASVDLANMDETDVTTFTYPTADSAAFADGCSFFRVRAALCEHAFNYPDTMPIIAPNMLVAAPGAIIDLSDGKPLDLSSFDTDATDPGTVWVKVAANTVPGATLISVPKTAEKSLKACRPKDCGDIAFSIVEEDGRLLLKVAGGEPAVEGDKGRVTVEGDKIVVTPNDGVKEVVLSNVGEKLVAIPSSVEKIVGVTDSKKLVVKSGTHDVTKAMKFTQESGGFKIALDETAVVKVGNEEIPVLPTLAEGDTEAPFEMSGGTLVFKVKSIPGLKYQVLVSDSLELNGFSPVDGSQKAASSARSELTVDQPANATRGFYKIQVSR